MTPADSQARWLLLRRAGVMVVLDVGGPVLPRVVHWGADIAGLGPDDCGAFPGARHQPPSDDARDADVPVTLSPSRAQGWAGWPGLSGHRDGAASQPLFALTEVTHTTTDDAEVVRYTGEDAAARLRLDAELRLTADGVVMHRQTLASVASSDDSPYTVDDLLTLLPVGEHVSEVYDHAGRWANEAQPQRQSLRQGTWLREQRRGRTGPDSPLLLTVGTAGFGFRAGEVWGVHLGWSGDQRYLAQRLNTGTTLVGAGEILAAGEVILGAGESVTTPWVYGVYSDRGLDGASARLHALLRRRPSHPDKPRPIVLNTWEAVYFDHSFERLAALADVAASVGVERFVVDDGWFGSRRDDTSGLGDWVVSTKVWPAGLRPLADHVRSRGMEFGLWFEPEMVNLDSDVARAHPDWVLGTPHRMPPPMRHQQVLDVSHPDAHSYLLEAMSALIEGCGIGYIKWDHNRDLHDPVHRGGPRAGHPAVRDQTLATYALMRELRRRHPNLEIESCSSGGSRVDYGVLEHTDRVWASDCIDPLERVSIVNGMSTLLPFELIGAHVASGRSHTTGRVHDLSLRLAVALFGHAGFEWDLTATSTEEREGLAQWVRFAKQMRPLIHSGELVRAPRDADPGTVLYGVVAADRSAALFNFVRLRSAPRYNSAPVSFPGLDPQRRYRVERVALPGEGPPVHGPGLRTTPEVIEASGALLSRAGIDAPTLRPEQAIVYHLRAAAR
ncbi:MAG TPA: alpha-galactosidase [Acidothermaceae bacterium]|jgi:alpha-galactosidase